MQPGPVSRRALERPGVAVDEITPLALPPHSRRPPLPSEDPDAWPTREQLADQATSPLDANARPGQGPSAAWASATTDATPDSDPTPPAGVSSGAPPPDETDAALSRRPPLRTDGPAPWPDGTPRPPAGPSAWSDELTPTGVTTPRPTAPRPAAAAPPRAGGPAPAASVPARLADPPGEASPPGTVPPPGVVLSDRAAERFARRVETLREQLTDARRALRKATAELEDRTRALGERETALTHTQRTLERTQARLDDVEKKHVALRDETIELRRTLLAKQAQLKKVALQHDSLRSLVALRAGRIRELETAVTKRDEKVEALEREARSARKSEEDAEHRVREYGDRAERAAASAARRQAQVVELERRLETTRAELAQRGSKNVALKTQVDELREAVMEAQRLQRAQQRDTEARERELSQAAEALAAMREQLAQASPAEALSALQQQLEEARRELALRAAAQERAPLLGDGGEHLRLQLDELTAERVSLLAAHEQALRRIEALERAPSPPAADDLRRIKGIGPGYERALHALGIRTYAAIAAWTDEDVQRVAGQLKTNAGRIHKAGWVAAARALCAATSTSRS